MVAPPSTVGAPPPDTPVAPPSHTPVAPHPDNPVAPPSDTPPPCIMTALSSAMTEMSPPVVKPPTPVNSRRRTSVAFQNTRRGSVAWQPAKPTNQLSPRYDDLINSHAPHENSTARRQSVSMTPRRRFSVAMQQGADARRASVTWQNMALRRKSVIHENVTSPLVRRPSLAQAQTQLKQSTVHEYVTRRRKPKR